MSHWIKPLEDEEADVLRDGHRMRVPLMMRDHADDNGQDAYEQRISDAWKNPSDVVASRPVVADEDSQAAYERRITNAWKGAGA